MAVKFDPILGKLREQDVGTGAVPSGGTTNQILAKNSNSDYDLKWQTPAGGGDMTKAVYDPTGKNASAFNQDNMIDGTTNKNYTATEQSKLSGIASGATAGADWNTNVSNKPTLGTASTKNIPATGNASATEVVYGSDTRLSDSRTPVTHSHVEGDITNLTTDLGNKVTANAGITGATKTKITYDAKGLVTAGADATASDVGAEPSGAVSTHNALTTGIHGSGINSLVYSNDSRLTDARTPSAHNQAETTITFTDVTTNNASTSNHGYFPKLPTASGKYLKDDMTWATPSGASGGTPALTLGTTNTAGVATTFIRTDDTILAFDATVPSTQAYGDAADAGVATVAARRDHKHAMPATTKDTTAVTGILKGNGSAISAATDGTDFYSSAYAIPAANVPNGITTVNTAIQSQVVVAGTYYYITGSALTMPASSKNGGGMSTSTTMQWQFHMQKSAAGTGAFNICIYRGTNGSTADTRDVTQSIGTATAATDNAVITVTLKVTATGATGSYTWGIAVSHKAATATGFGTTDATPFFTGTVSSVAMNTGSLKFGLGFMNATGTPTVQVAGCTGVVNNMN